MNNPLLDTSGLPRFADITPDHVLPALTEIIARHREHLDTILAGSQEARFDNIVAPVEEMEHELSRVWSPVNHLQTVLGSPAWREAYNAVLPMLTEYGSELSQNARLQAAYAKVDAALPEGSSASRKSALQHALREFRLGGVDLEEKAKARFREIMRELAAIQAKFDHNVLDSADAWQLGIDDIAELDGLPECALNRARQAAIQADRDGWLLKLDHPTHDVVMKHAVNRALRENFYHAWVTRASDQAADTSFDNSDNLQHILRLRQEAANLLGFATYADYSLATKMASSADEVIGFIRELAERTRPAAEKELAELRELAGMAIEPWDLAFWLEKLKQRKFSISNEVLRQYFPANQVIGGLFDLARTLYGVTFAIDESVASWDPESRYYEVFSETGELIGSFYTDLFARSGKRTGAWVDDCVNRKNLDGKVTLPIGFLVCNFSPPGDGKQALLTHDDVVTLFHEFGHMLHHLLTRVDYPSISGINGVPWDAVELPSQFMENFAWNFKVLEACSEHAQSGERLPRALFDKLLASRHTGAALSMLRQLEFGLFDFRLHNESGRDADIDVLGLLAEVRAEVSLIEPPAYNRFPHGFTHIFAGGYAAGYYSYKWAEVLAADAFAAFEEAGIFDRATADRFRREILEIGGSRDFMEAYVAFRGRRPKLDAILRQSGIAVT
ncbi:MAG TPA: M3 family metallopeptidase [Woeseiaceae bacterium]|nr:M3 family metallopeptidase [Woeseiaceae bacterium]